MAKKKKKKIPLQKVVTNSEQSPPIPKEQKSILKSYLPFLILGLSTIALYIQTLPYEYVLDDQIVYTDNKFTKAGFNGIADLFTTESFSGYFGEQKDLLPGSRYRPLSLVSFAIEYQLFGQKSNISHLINALLYALLCMIIYKVLLRLIPPSPQRAWYLSLAFFASLLYTLHPLHTEAVANVKGRDEIMAMIFSMLSLYAAMKSLDKNRILWLGAMSVCFFLGLLSKENTLTFIAIIPISILFLKNKTFKDIIPATAVLLSITIAYIFIRYQVIGYLISSGKLSEDLMNNPFINMTGSEKYATITYTLLRYLYLDIIPHPLTHDYYPFQIPTKSWWMPEVLLTVAIYGVLIIASIYGFFKKKIWAYGIIFYLVTLSIVSNLVLTVGTTMNERFVFMASLGICIWLAHILINFLPSLHKRWGKYISYVLMAAFIIGFTVKSITRIPVWRNPETLNAAAVQVSTNSARANSFMATALYQKIQRKEVTGAALDQTLADADYYASRAIMLFPKYGNANLMKSGIVTEYYKTNRDLDYLLREFKSIASRRPDISFLHEYFEHLNSRADNTKLTNFYYDVGYNVLYQSKQFNWAIKYLTYGYQISPNNYNINFALQQAYSAAGNQDKSAEHGFKAQSLRANAQ